MNINEMKIKLEDSLSTRRYMHCLNVMNVSMDLAKKYGEDREKAAIAGLLHDCAREINKEKAYNLCKEYDIEIDNIMMVQVPLLHGPIGSNIARDEYNVSDNDILNSIYYHTTGRENMSKLEKIVYIADFIEPSRAFSKVNQARKMAYKDIDKCIKFVFDRTIKNIISKNGLIHPLTFKARNHIIFENYK